MPRAERPSPAEAERFRRLMELFEAARQRAGSGRAAWLAEACAGDDGLRADVERMLAEDRAERGALEAGQGLQMFDERASSRGSVSGIEALEPDVEPLPLLRGDYRVLGRLGEGGSGVVYEAEQAFPRRRVALKALRAGRASRRALARFEQEAHILGRLQHPGIAQLFEAGSADAERGDQAYLVMELVQGLPLTEYVFSRLIPRRDAVELLAQIADAVQHAHQRRVIHRDLKPANILVTPAGAPKILDFGIARLVEDDVELSRTTDGRIVGTLPYMSPEQVAGDGAEIDARVDVYALGVLLYELLTGRLPCSPQNRSLPELLVAIQSETPKPPSALDATIPADLGAVCLRALEKDRERRYASAAEFASDLRRWLQGRPVLARGDSALYVFAKFVRRHRALAALTALALVALAAFAVELFISARREARNSRELADALHQANLERGRLLAASGDVAQAEAILWREQRAQPDESTWWALWELYSAHPIVRSFPAPASAPVALAQSPDERRLAAGTHDGTVVVWDLGDGSTVELESRTHSPARDLQFLGAARVLVLDNDHVATCFDIGARAASWTAADCAFVAADPTGRCVALCRADGRTAFVQPDTGVEIEAWPALDGGTEGIALARGGDALARGGARGDVLIERRGADRAQRRVSIGSAAVTALAWSADGAGLAAGDASGRIVVLDAVAGAELAELPAACGRTRTLQLDRDAQRLLISGSEGCAVFELASRRRLDIAPELRVQSPSLALLADGLHAAAVGADRHVRVWELEPLPRAQALDAKVPEDSVVGLGLEARLFAAALPTGGLEIHRLRDGALVAECRPSTFYLAISFDSDQRRIAAGGLEPRVDLFDTASGERLRSLQLARAPAVTVRFSHDGARLAVAVTGEGVEIWDLERGVVERVLGAGHADPVRIAFSPDSSRLAIAHVGGELTLWNVASGAHVDPVAIGSSISAVRWIGDGHTFAVGGVDGRLVLVDERRMADVRVLQERGAPIGVIGATADGRRIAAGGQDGATRIWDCASGRALATLAFDSAPIGNASFDRAAQTLWVYHRDGTIVRWDLARAAAFIAGNARAFDAEH